MRCRNLVRVMIPVCLLVGSGGSIGSIVGSSSLVYASQVSQNEVPDIKNFTDYSENLGYGKISGHWAESIISTTIKAGGIAGYPEGDFRPNKEITAAELLSIIFSVTDTDTGSGGWSERIMNTAYSKGIVTEGLIPMSDASKPISREKMAYILVKSAEILCLEDTSSQKNATVSDLASADPACQDAIQRAYNMGLLAGKGDGFAPKDSTTRAETCAVVNRLMKYSDRVDNFTQKQEPVTPSDAIYEALPDGSNVGQSTGAIYPSEGQLYNGKPITRDPNTGVLGYGNGQTGGIYLGVPVLSGSIKEGSALAAGDGYDNAVGHYEKHGDYTYWGKEWALIARHVEDKLNSEAKNAPAYSTADIYGNVLTGVSPSSDEAFAYKTESGGWVFKY